MEAAAEFTNQTFDYIVVGGGNTGLALASLLSADPRVRVGVIEAGLRKDDEMILLPGMIGKPLNNPDYDWSFSTKPQALAKNRRIPLSRGKVLGGTSALNYMAYTRGSKIEFNDWEKLGITGWDWNTIRDAVNAAEAWTPPSDYAKLHNADNVAHNHGRHGYVKTTAYSYYYDLVLPFFNTMNKLGVVTNYSEASGDLIGAWTYTASVDPQTNIRSYSTNAYYDRVSSRPNIVCLTGAYVSKVVLSDSKNGVSRTMGVEFYSSGQLFFASARREVILSAGALQTPQILELSGIGNPNILRKLGIPLKVDLPGVGENLQDHFTVTMGAELHGHHITADDLSSEHFAHERLREYRETRRGMLSSTLSSLVFLPASTFIPADTMKRMLASLDRALQTPEIKDSPYKQWYDLQRAWLENDGVAQLEIILFPSYTHVGCTKENAKHYTLSVFLQHAWSRGTVHATSTSIFEPPEIDLATLDSPGDIDMTMLLEAIKYTFKIMQAGALGDLTAKIVEPLPTWSDDQLREYIRSMVKSAFHQIGTAAMLPRSANGVVDNGLKVYGTANLRVADASILPIHLGSHPQATLYGLAHRAADIITSQQEATAKL
ncbi:alcohol oxidase [Boletus edulis BED1]|uniref:Alcohol oxidase n=1 Tax=Boletus edulis BED1 TaxID=1328754 RepID=A0AAD4GHZ7_BOLED|nr:alcohol oxidase [Boletus edulis BED1]